MLIREAVVHGHNASNHDGDNEEGSLRRREIYFTLTALIIDYLSMLGILLYTTRPATLASTHPKSRGNADPH